MSVSDIDVTKRIEQHQQLDRERRMKVVLDHFSMCESVRKKLELSNDALPLIDKMLRDLNQHDHRAHHHEPDAPATRGPLHIKSEKKILHTDPLTGSPTAVNVSPQCAGLRVEEIEILSHPSAWMIADIQVGGRTQFPQAGPPLPGHLFVPGHTCHHFVCETLQTAMDFTMLVHYVGHDPEGAIFEAVAMGHIAR